MVTTMDTIMDKRIDIHTHILPGVDDGSKSINESLEIIDYLKSVGITDIILTSHYMKGTSYEYNTKSRIIPISINDEEVGVSNNIEIEME